VPDVPAGLSASAASASQINLSWTASPTATSYVVYRSSTDSGYTSSIATGVSGTSYQDTGLTANTQYFYEVAGVNSSGEGSNSTSANATTNAASSGGGGGVISGSLSVGSQSNSNSSNNTGNTNTSSPNTVVANSSPQLKLSSNTQAANVIFTRSLYIGSSGNDVSHLQVLLGVGQTGYFGALTRAAVEAFQEKYHIAKKGDSGYGGLGPKTQTKIAEVFGGGVTSPTSSTQGQSLSGNVSATPPSFVRILKPGSQGTDVLLLQKVLNSDPSTQVTTIGEGSPGSEGSTFGNMTLQAVIKFQLKYGIARKGDPSLGVVGPKTRAKMNDLLAVLLAGSAVPTNTIPATTLASTTIATSTATTTSTTTITATSTSSH
jgi:hypothetical protein